MNKVLLLICLWFGLTTIGLAQEMTVMSFNSLPQDLSARTHPRTDLNGDPCALIKVQIPELNNINFEGWVIDQKYTPGEYLVYVPANTKKIIVKHPNFLPLEYVFPEKIEGKVTYKMVIQLPKTINEKKIVHIKTNVLRAKLIFNGEEYLTENAQFSVSSVSPYCSVKIEAMEGDFVPYETTLEINNDEIYKELICNLKSNTNYNILYTADRNSVISVDGEPVNTNGSSISVSSGIHDIEVRLGKWHKIFKVNGTSGNVSVDLSLHGEITFSYPYDATFKIEPKNYESFMPSAKVVKTGSKVCLLGDYKITVSKKGYDTRTIDITVNECEYIDNYRIPLYCKADELNRLCHYEKAYAEYDKMAKRKDDHALYVLGEYLYEGKGCTPDLVKALQTWKIAADEGNTDAMLRYAKESPNDEEKEPYLLAAANLGIHEAQYLLAGLYVKKGDYIKSIECYKKISHQYVDANYRLGEIYNNGLGVEKNPLIAESYYRIGSCAGDERCDERLYDFLYNSGKEDEACREYLKLKDPSSETRLKLGIYYHKNGEDEEAAKQLSKVNTYEIKERNNYANLYCEIADKIYYTNRRDACYLFDVATNKLGYVYKRYQKNYEDIDLPTAKIYYEIGSCTGDERCTERLIDMMYESGFEDEACEDYKKLIKPSSMARYRMAVNYREKEQYVLAAEQLLLVDVHDIESIDDESFSKLCCVVANKIYAEDKKNACNLFEIAVEQLNYKYDEAYYKLGLFYEKTDSKKAVMYYEKAVNVQNVRVIRLAMCHLGYCYEMGLGVNQDYTKAAECYTKSIELGNVAANRFLGTLYAKGRGVPMDLDTAVKYWIKAGEYGEEGAVRQLIKYYTNKKLNDKVKYWEQKLNVIIDEKKRDL